jgi:cytochrome c oxidase assembly factor CtaG
VSDEHLQIWTTWVLVAALLFLVGFGFWVLVIRTVRRRRRRSWPPAMISSSSSSEKQALHASACRYVLFSTIEVVLGIL